MRLDEELINFVSLHEQDDIHYLALHASKYPDIDMQMAIRQISGRKIAKEKIPSWYANNQILYPKHLSMEQCSSEATAVFKSSLCKGITMADLTGGFGVDCAFLASGFRQSIYVEQQTELAEIASYNFNVLGLDSISVENREATDYLSSMQPVDLIYIDPARRDDSGRKTVLIEDCTPNILDIEDLLDDKAAQTMIKLSPMLDISLAAKSLKSLSDVYIISVGNECKELLFVKNRKSDALQYHCVNIYQGKTDVFTFSKEDEDAIILNYTPSVGKYLYEPNSSVLKGGAYKSIAKRFSLNKLHPSSHLYTSEVLENDFYGRKFEVEAISTFSKKDLKTNLKDITQANITVRNFPLSVQEIRKKTGLKEGGDVYIFATTLSDEKKVLIITRKV